MDDFFDIEGFQGLYQVSPTGEVRSVKRNIIMKPLLYQTGYLMVRLRKDKKEYQLAVHRLVAKTFVNKKLSRNDVVNHIDGNKLNNHVSNLEWTTIGDNVSKAWETGLNNCRGSKNGRAVVSENDVKEIRRLYSTGVSTRELIKIYPIAKNTMNSIVKNKTWKHLL